MTFGALGAWATGRAMQSLLFGVSPLHLGVMAAAATLMGLPGTYRHDAQLD